MVLTREEVEAILTHLSGTVGLMIRLLYGTGMRILECVRLGVKDVEFARGEIVVRQGKGARERMTMLPQSLAVPLNDHLVRVKKLHEADLEPGYGELYTLMRFHASIRALHGTPRCPRLRLRPSRAPAPCEKAALTFPPVQAVPWCGSPDPTSVLNRVAGGV